MNYNMKVLVATEKPFSKTAVEGIRRVIEEAGHEFDLLEKYSSPKNSCSSRYSQRTHRSVG